MSKQVCQKSVYKNRYVFSRCSLVRISIETDAHDVNVPFVFFYLQTTVTLLSIYSGNLTAFFSIRRDSPAINTLKELADSSLEPHVTFGQSHYYIFENATGGARGKIWRKMQACDDCVHKHHSTTSSMEFVAGIVSGQRALFQSQRALLNRADKYLAHTNQTASALCPLRLARQALRRDFYSLMFPHHSPYSALFDRAIRQLRYQGVIKRIFSQVASNKCTRTAAPHHEVTPLDMHRLAGAFYVWAAGLSAAAVVCLLEGCLGGSRRRRRRAEGRKRRKTEAENGHRVNWDRWGGGRCWRKGRAEGRLSYDTLASATDLEHVVPVHRHQSIAMCSKVRIVLALKELLKKMNSTIAPYISVAIRV